MAIDQQTAVRDIAAIEKALRAGHTPRGQRPKGGEFGAIAVAALELEIPYKTLDDRVRPGGLYERLGHAVDWDLYDGEGSPTDPDPNVAARRGELGFEPVLPGFEIARTSTTFGRDGDVSNTSVTQKPERGPQFELPERHQIKGISSLLGPDGRVTQQWVKTREGITPQFAAEVLKTAFADYEYPALPIEKPSEEFIDALTFYPISDMHVGLYAWKDETDKNWDLRIAERELGAAASRLVSMSTPTKRAIILGGGDAMHADNKNNETSNSGNRLDVDGRYDKVLLATCFLFVRIIDLALQRHEEIDVRVLKGNHDLHASVAIGYFLLAHYRNEPRVTVDVSASLFWFYRFGKVMLAATHGHEAKPEKMPLIMAVDRPEDWAKSTHRIAHTFHVHHTTQRSTEVGGVIIETHQAPCARDAWHHGAGYRSGRSLCSIVYDKEHGEIARSRVAL